VNVLVINAGSSSLKFQLIEADESIVRAKGQVERIGFDDAVFQYARGDEKKTKDVLPVQDHKVAMKLVLSRLLDTERGVVGNISEIGAFGHRFVNGGNVFMESVVANDETLEKIRSILDIAPLHNPAHLLGIEACIEAAPSTPQIIVFDTAFHARVKPESYLYALPYKYYEKYGIRKYGFHGTSHYFVSHRAAELMGRPVEDLKIITCHLGNGASIDAVKDGWAIETSMGFTPHEGLIMGSRTGDVDAAAILYIMKREGLSPEEMDTIINKKSGILGITGISSDMREIEDASAAGNKKAILAMDMYAHRIKKYIGAYAALMGGVDAIVFTAGVGENGPITREGSCRGLEFLGIDIDEQKNTSLPRGAEADISRDGSRVRIFVLPTNEEIVIAREAERLCAAR
jgi:acetate kinase